MRFTFFIIYLIVIFTDQASKYLAINMLSDVHYISVNSLLNFGPILMNKGISFGFFHNMPNVNLIMIILNSLVIFILFISIHRIPAYKYSLHTVCAAAISNILDRIQHHSVVDFIDLHFHNYHFPTFNLADMYITITLLSLFLQDIRQNIKSITPSP